MRKVQIVRRPVVLSLGAHPRATATAPDLDASFAADTDDDLDGNTVLEDGGDAMDALDTLDVHADAPGDFDAIEDDLEDEPTIVTPSLSAVVTSRTSTSTVSASTRLEVIKQSRKA